MSIVLDIIKNKQLTYEQKVMSLARLAENSIDILDYSVEAREFINHGIICELFEGNAPYRPRYILPNYEKLFAEGCKFLDLQKPTTLYEAINNLLIFYKHVPSITSFPVYLGSLDKLLDPYIGDRDEAKKTIKLFFNHIDKTLTDSFIQVNLGPEKTVAGEIILEVSRELQLPIPNISLLYDENITEDSFFIDCLNTALITAKPSVANHKMFENELGDYGIASCYNGLKIGGGGYTLVRLKLGTLALKAKNKSDFFNYWLPKAIDLQLEIMDKRIKFIVEEANFFETNFLSTEGFINKEDFTGMFGLIGLADCVNTLLNVQTEKLRYGHNKEANNLGVEIIEFIHNRVNKHKGLHCENFNDRYLLHSQVGIDTDLNESPGCRIPVGEEPELHKHLIQSSTFHKYFPSGIGDVFVFDQTYKNNLEALKDIVKGSFHSGLRYISLYSQDSDVVRVTGYLVKKSEIKKLEEGKVVLRDTTVLGKGSREYGKSFERRIRK